MDIIALKLYCYQIEVWIQFLLTMVIIFINYMIFHRTGRAKQIIKSKPMIRNSKGLSIILTLLFFLITASWLFWGSIYGKHILSHCK